MPELTCHWGMVKCVRCQRKGRRHEGDQGQERPRSLGGIFHALGFAVTRIGLEAGPLSQWLYAGLTQAGFETTLLETRHVKAALSAMTVKTDRQDAQGIAGGRPKFQTSAPSGMGIRII